MTFQDILLPHDYFLAFISLWAQVSFLLALYEVVKEFTIGHRFDRYSGLQLIPAFNVAVIIFTIAYFFAPLWVPLYFINKE